MNKPNTVYDMEIDSLNKLLEDAEADEELTQLVSESEETEKPIATGTEEKKPEEVEVKTVEDPTCTNQEAEDIKPVETEKENTPTEKQVDDATKAEDEKLKEESEQNTTIPTLEHLELKDADDSSLEEDLTFGTEEKKPEEAEVKDADPTETVSDSTDIDLKKPIQDGEHSDIKVEDPTCTNQEATDIKPVESEKENTPTEKQVEDATKAEDEKLKEESEANTSVPTLEQLELKDTDDSSLEEDLTFGTEERTPDDEHIEYVDPTHTVEETEDIDLKKPIQDGEHSDINIEDPTCTNQEAEDIKPVESEKENTPTEKQVADATKAEDKKLNEAIDELNKFIMSLNEEEGLPEDKVGTEERAPKEETVKDADPTCTKQEAEDVAPAKPECCEHKECKSVKEVIEAGTDNFKTEEEKKKLTECIALVLAHENNDLMFEEYNRLLSEAISLRESLIKKYSIIATNRTNSLLEGMTQMEERLENTKNDMFKKLNEQKEINSAKDNTKVLNPETAAFTNTDKLKVDL